MWSVIASLAIILGLAFILEESFKRTKLPAVIGQIVAGFIAGLAFFKPVLFQIAGTQQIFDGLALLGAVFLLLLVGLEIDINMIKQSSREAFIISLAAAIIPLVFGTMLLLAFGYNLTMALVFGGALSVTAEGTTVKILMDMDVLNTRLGAIIVSAGGIDDIFEVLYLSAVTVIGLGGNVFELVLLPAQLIGFAVLSIVLFRVMTWLLSVLDGDGDGVELYSVVLIFVFGIAALSEVLSLGYLLGAVVAGFMLKAALSHLKKCDGKEIIVVTRMIALAFVVPFFFVSIGLSFDLSLFQGNLILVAATTIVAIIGKLAGTMLVKPLSKLSWRQLYTIGWGMNSRGAVELVIALVAAQAGLISQEVYLALISMALITTLVFPFAMQHEIRRDPHIMD